MVAVRSFVHFFFLRIPFAVLFRSLQVVAQVKVDLETLKETISF